MAGDSADKTEKATPKRKREAAKQGQVARSADLTGWAGMLAATFLFPSAFSGVQTQLMELLTALPRIGRSRDIQQALEASSQAMLGSAMALLPLLLGIALVTLLVGVAQGGARPYGSRLKPKFSRINAFASAKRMVGPQGAWELIKNLLKTFAVGYAVYRSVAGIIPLIESSGTIPLTDVVSALGGILLQTIRWVCIVALVLASVDYLVARRRITKQTMMSRKEVTDEMRQSDGDPMLKSAIRQRMMAMSRNRMMQDVATADVVLVNPTHVAVALRYVPGRGAPRVVAKGQGAVAARIRELATENRVPMVEDIPLARAINKACDIGAEIPADFYTAIARVLAFVMTLRQRGAASGLHRRTEVELAAAAAARGQ
jgi:flagellar biosynthetic protein FlhB